MGAPGPRDLNDLALVLLALSLITKFSKRIRRESPERGSQAEFVREFQRVIHILQAQPRCKDDTAIAVTLGHAAGVANDLGARGLAAGKSRGDDVQVKSRT